MKQRWRRSRQNRNHPTPTPLYENGATSASTYTLLRALTYLGDGRARSPLEDCARPCGVCSSVAWRGASMTWPKRNKQTVTRRLDEPAVICSDRRLKLLDPYSLEGLEST